MLNYTYSCYPKRFFFPPEILESQGTVSSSTTTATSTITTQAEVHQQPVLDLEVKMEMYDYEEEGNGDEIEELAQDTSAASALLPLSRSQSTFNPDNFKSLWEGTLNLFNLIYVALSVFRHIYLKH